MLDKVISALKTTPDGRDPQQFAFALLENRVGAWLGVMTIGLLIVTIAQRKFLAGRDFDLRTIGIALLPACILASLMQMDSVNAHVDPVVIAILPLLLVEKKIRKVCSILVQCLRDTPERWANRLCQR